MRVAASSSGCALDHGPLLVWLQTVTTSGYLLAESKEIRYDIKILRRDENERMRAYGHGKVKVSSTCRCGPAVLSVRLVDEKQDIQEQRWSAAERVPRARG